ncbi:NAD+ synthase [candidate division FCPU426 bacterium]|nr:NAD+ synthase [candidate division FCPU426 bacterium]
MSVIGMGLAQINPVLGDFETNSGKIRERISQARDLGLAMVVFPEMALCGYPPEDLLHRRSFIRANQAALEKILPHTAGINALVGFVHAQGGFLHNAAAWMRDGQLLSVYHKVELPNYGVFDEKRYFTPGTGPMLVDFAGVRLAVTVCEDIWVDGGSVEASIRKHRVQLVINMSASPFYAGKTNERQRVLAGLARRTGAHIGYVNVVGGQDELVFDGVSMVVNSEGKVVARGGSFQEELVTSFLELPGTPPGFKDTAADVQSRPCGLKAATEGDNTMVPALEPLEEIHAALILGTRDYVRKNGFVKVVLGLSGGVDSALTAAVAVAALGKENVIGVTMPSAYSSAGTRADAIQLAENLGIRILTLPIQPMLEAYEQHLQEAMGPGQPGIEHENLQARIRANILMALSNRFGWLVLTTGNKSETAVGYCTLYGDMAGGLAVIKDVPKTMVYELVRHINQQAGRQLIPAGSIERPPTAELRPNQKDEDSLPPYAMLDKILKAYVEEDTDPDEIIAQGFSAEIVNKSIRLVDQNEYKRRQAPLGIKITPKAFGRDRRLPVTNRFCQPPSQ